MADRLQILGIKNGFVQKFSCIVSAKRSAIGSFCGSLSSIPAHEIGSQVIKDLIKKTAVDVSQIDEIILGQVLSAGQGQNPARQAAIMAGLPVEKTAVGINQVCGAGLRAVAMGMQQLSMVDANIVIAGGQEKYVTFASLLPHAQCYENG